MTDQASPAAEQQPPAAYPAPPQPGQPRYATAPRPGRPGASRSLARSGPAARVIASFLDWAIILAVSVVIYASRIASLLRQIQAVAASRQAAGPAAVQAAISNLSREPATVGIFVHIWLTAFGLAAAYFWISHLAWGCTLGKRVLGLRVVTSAGRNPIGVRAAGLRAAAYLAGPAALLLAPAPVSYLGGALWLADGLAMLADPRSRCLHDRLAGTIAVARHPAGQPS